MNAKHSMPKLFASVETLDRRDLPSSGFHAAPVFHNVTAETRTNSFVGHNTRGSTASTHLSTHVVRTSTGLGGRSFAPTTPVTPTAPIPVANPTSPLLPKPFATPVTISSSVPSVPPHYVDGTPIYLPDNPPSMTHATPF